MTSRSDEALVREARCGSREAFDELVRRFRDRMIAIAREAIGSREAAEDVVQDAFLQALHALPQLHDPARFGHWLAVITRCRARRVGARDRRFEPTDPAALDNLLSHRSDGSLHPADEYVRRSGAATIQAALARMPSDLETVLRLYYYEEWTIRRIAAHLAVPISTVKWRLYHGRKLLRRQLGMELGAGAVSLLQKVRSYPGPKAGPRCNWERRRWCDGPRVHRLVRRPVGGDGPGWRRAVYRRRSRRAPVPLSNGIEIPAMRC